MYKFNIYVPSVEHSGMSSHKIVKIKIAHHWYNAHYRLLSRTMGKECRHTKV